MNKKEMFGLIVGFVFSTSPIHTRTIKKTLISIVERNCNNITFKHIIKSNKLLEEFFVDDIPVLEEDFYHKLDEAEQQEREEQREREIKERREKIEFTVDTQNKILSKLILQTVSEIEQAVTKLQHPALQNYLLFSSETIPSQHEFDELTAITNYVKHDVPKLIEGHNTERLEFYESKLAIYPERLELLFRSSVDEAIQKCDNTSNLKDLLELVAEG